MMPHEYQDYKVWQEIDYSPAVREFLPEALLPHLQQGQRIVDIGCNKGYSATWLAEKGFKVLGIDVNPEAIASARSLARKAGVESRVEFRCRDFLKENLPVAVFDAVVLTRLLTCVPDSADWEASLIKIHSLLNQGGILYVHDFLMDLTGPSYVERYKAGEKKGWQRGNFEVRNKEGAFLFIAHHHTPEELERLKSSYIPLYSRGHRSLSMNGNSCLMFEFIGRKT